MTKTKGKNQRGSESNVHMVLKRDQDTTVDPIQAITLSGETIIRKNPTGLKNMEKKIEFGNRSTSCRGNHIDRDTPPIGRTVLSNGDQKII